MPRRSSPLSALTDRFGLATTAISGAIVVASIVAVFFGAWLHDPRFQELTAFDAELVTRGQLWRLVTYPWIETGLLGLLFSVWALVIFMAALERVWGTRRTLIRSAVLVVLPPAAVSLLALLHAPLLDVRTAGPTTLISAIVVAFASELPGAQIGLLFLPIRLSGDTLIWLEAAILGLNILFSGTILGFAVHIFAFLLALAWFRFHLVRDLRRLWLRLRKRQIESRMTKLRRQRNLRIVSSDDDDDDQPGRLLH